MLVVLSTSWRPTYVVDDILRFSYATHTMMLVSSQGYKNREGYSKDCTRALLLCKWHPIKLVDSLLVSGSGFMGQI